MFAVAVDAGVMPNRWTASGPSVKLTNIEISTADDDGQTELVKKLADDAVHEADGQEHRHDGQGGGHAPPGRFRCVPSSRGVVRCLAHLHMPHDVLAHHDGVVDQQAHAQATSAISVTMFMVKPKHVHESGTCRSWQLARSGPVMTVERQEFRNKNTINTVSRPSLRSGFAHVVDRHADWA
jgi:hypothetical protein